MKKIVMCFLFIVLSNFIRAQYVFTQQSRQSAVSSIQDIINNSEIDSGFISFEKKGIYCEYQYKDSLTLIRVLDFFNEKKRIIFFDTRSPAFDIYGIKVGLPESEIKDILNELGSPRIKQTEYGFDMEYVMGGYWLIIEFSESKVSRIYYNPFE